MSVGVVERSTYEKMIANLRDAAEKHRNDLIFTGDVNVALMADDAANAIEELLNFIFDNY